MQNMLIWRWRLTWHRPNRTLRQRSLLTAPACRGWAARRLGRRTWRRMRRKRRIGYLTRLRPTRRSRRTIEVFRTERDHRLCRLVVRQPGSARTLATAFLADLHSLAAGPSGPFDWPAANAPLVVGPLEHEVLPHSHALVDRLPVHQVAPPRGRRQDFEHEARGRTFDPDPVVDPRPRGTRPEPRRCRAPGPCRDCLRRSRCSASSDQPLVIHGPDGGEVRRAPGLRDFLKTSRPTAQATPAGAPDQGGQAPLNPPGGDREMKTQGVSVRATRKPRSLFRNPVPMLKRTAERRALGPKPQEPPRKARSEQSPRSQALPSDGAPT